MKKLNLVATLPRLDSMSLGQLENKGRKSALDQVKMKLNI